MKKIALSVVLGPLAALALASCGGGSDTSSTPASTTPTTTPAATGGGGGGGSASGGGSTVKVSADPTGALKYEQTKLSAKAGSVAVDFTNDSPVSHNVTIEDSNDNDVGATDTISGDSTSTTVNLKPGSYTFYCSVDGHEAAGMKGTLTVK
jgi:plastocyanin